MLKKKKPRDFLSPYEVERQRNVVILCVLALIFIVSGTLAIILLTDVMHGLRLR